MNKKLNMQLNCPMPKLDYEIITLGHGSGGLLTNKLLNDGVFSLFENDLLAQNHDGATFNLDGELAFSTDSFVVSPISFPGGNIGDLAVNGTVNDLAMCGAVPKYLSLAFIIEEGLTMKEFWDVLVAIKKAVIKAEVQVVTGDTKVVEKGKGDKIFINTSGIGVVHPKANINVSNIKVGDKIFVSGGIATHGMAIMSVREGLEFESDILSDTQNLNHLTLELIEEFGDKIRFLRDPTRGGVGTTLAEIVQKQNWGINIYQSMIPIHEHVEAACELLGIEPLYVANEGILIAVVDPKIEDEFLSKIRKNPKAQNAAMIGEISEEHIGKFVLHNAIGGRRLVKMLPGEQLPRIC